MEVGMSLLSSATVLRLVDSMAIILSQAYQLARARLASSASPIVRLLVQRDQAFRAPYLNGKLERAFRTFRVWWRLVLTGLTQRGIQRRLDHFGAWFNEHREHSTLHGRTPQEAWEGRVLPEPIPIRARDQFQPQIEVRRRHYRDDPRLPVLEISVRLAA
jgi:hypothetical protein